MFGERAASEREVPPGRVGEKLRTGSGAGSSVLLPAECTPRFANGGSRAVSSGVRKGGREGGACSLRSRTTG